MAGFRSLQRLQITFNKIIVDNKIPPTTRNTRIKLWKTSNNNLPPGSYIVYMRVRGGQWAGSNE